jgi:hypothetical protein
MMYDADRNLNEIPTIVHVHLTITEVLGNSFFSLPRRQNDQRSPSGQRGAELVGKPPFRLNGPLSTVASAHHYVCRRKRVQRCQPAPAVGMRGSEDVDTPRDCDSGYAHRRSACAGG